MNSEDWDDLVDRPKGSESEHLPLLMRMTGDERASHHPVVEADCTLRLCVRDYAKEGGVCYKGSSLEEYDGVERPGVYSPMRRYSNMVGHFVDGRSIGYQPVIHRNLRVLLRSVADSSLTGTARKYLWDAVGTDLIEYEAGTWSFGGLVVPPSESSALRRVSNASIPPPFSLYTWHAHAESLRRQEGHAARELFSAPEETPSLTGLVGTLHVNQMVDASPGEVPGVPNKEARELREDHMGFLCVSHTSHSSEAGRMRKVTRGARIRVCGNRTLSVLRSAARRVVDDNEEKEWLVYCMGHMAYCSLHSLMSLVDSLLLGRTNPLETPTVHIGQREKVAVVSISSGVLLVRGVSGKYCDSTEVHYGDGATHCITAEDSDDALRAYFSSLPQLNPYNASNRPPRNVIASSQMPQSTTLPWSPATSWTSPVNSQFPLVHTQMTSELYGDGPMRWQEDSLLQAADVLPGINVTVLLAEWNEVYEDCAMIRRSAVERGLFERSTRSSYALHSAKEIPDVGELANIHANKWYKTWHPDRASGMKCLPMERVNSTTGEVERRTVAQVPNSSNYAKVTYKEPTEAGGYTARVLSNDTMVTGDKVGTLHGQKFTVLVVSDEDMPWGVDRESHESVQFDMIVSPNSITKRMTAGQWYEVAMGQRVAMDPSAVLKEYGVHYVPDMCKGLPPPTADIYAGETGELLTLTGKDGDEVELTADYGIARFMPLTQTTRDRQHYTDKVPGAHVMSAPHGRGKSGGVRAGEMEYHAMEASGLTGAQEDLRSRTDVVLAEVCEGCRRQAVLCPCGTSARMSLVAIPFSTLREDCATLLTQGAHYEYLLS